MCLTVRPRQMRKTVHRLKGAVCHFCTTNSIKQNCKRWMEADFSILFINSISNYYRIQQFLLCNLNNNLYHFILILNYINYKQITQLIIIIIIIWLWIIIIFFSMISQNLPNNMYCRWKPGYCLHIFVIW